MNKQSKNVSAHTDIYGMTASERAHQAVVYVRGCRPKRNTLLLFRIASWTRPCTLTTKWTAQATRNSGRRHDSSCLVSFPCLLSYIAFAFCFLARSTHEYNQSIRNLFWEWTYIDVRVSCIACEYPYLKSWFFLVQRVQSIVSFSKVKHLRMSSQVISMHTALQAFTITNVLHHLFE